tara:strand:- start:46 stop:414 length:369 start_codon:yes stop_codon:yes gene_type:complete
MDNFNLKKYLAEGKLTENFGEYSNDALVDMIVNLSRYQDNEEDIKDIKKELERRKMGSNINESTKSNALGIMNAINFNDFSSKDLLISVMAELSLEKTKEEAVEYLLKIAEKHRSLWSTIDR